MKNKGGNKTYFLILSTFAALVVIAAIAFCIIANDSVSAFAINDGTAHDSASNSGYDLVE